MKYLGVIGYPLTHSLSPALQQAALDHLRLDIVYEPWPTSPDALTTRMTGLRAPAVLGANVTIPHKEAVMPVIDEVDDLARKAGAVNTIVNREGRLCGYNTDVAGFLRSLRDDGGFEVAGRRAVIAGAGGAARAVAVALIEARAASIAITNRTHSRAGELVEDIQAQTNAVEFRVFRDDVESWDAALADCDLLVNCTPVGASGTPGETESPVPEDLIHPNMLVYDLIYRPEKTPLMQAAVRRGARVLGGLPMLVYQGAASFEIWTGREAPVDIMFKAVREATGVSAARGKR